MGLLIFSTFQGLTIGAPHERHMKDIPMSKLPIIDKELIEYLERICPDASPSLSTPDREIWFQAGKVDLVRHLKSIHQDQHDNALEGFTDV